MAIMATVETERAALLDEVTALLAVSTRRLAVVLRARHADAPVLLASARHGLLAVIHGGRVLAEISEADADAWRLAGPRTVAIGDALPALGAPVQSLDQGERPAGFTDGLTSAMWGPFAGPLTVVGTATVPTLRTSIIAAAAMLAILLDVASRRMADPVDASNCAHAARMANELAGYWTRRAAVNMA